MTRVSFAYVQARLQARHGSRPDEGAWRILAAGTELASYLRIARGTPLRTWVVHLSPGTDVALIERSLRRDWLALVRHVAVWPPGEWRDAVSWVGELTYLPALDHLLRGRETARWMRDDPVLAPVALEQPEARRRALAASRFEPLVTGWHRGQTVLEAWASHWRRLWPAMSRRARAGLTRLEDTLREHVASTAVSGREAPVSEELRAFLAHRFARLFRSEAPGPVPLFCHLGLIALDLERLRAGLVTRRLHPGGVAG